MTVAPPPFETSTKTEVEAPSAAAVSVVIPVTSADAPLHELVPAYDDALRASGYRHEIVVVLDGVRGAIEHELEKLARTRPVRVVRLRGSGLGEAVALAAGIERAAGDLIVCAPQYLQADPEDVVKVARTLENGADCVATWRDPRIDPWLNRVQSWLFNYFLRWLMAMRFHDLNSGLRGIRRNVLQEVNLYGDLSRFLPVLALRKGYRVVEIKVRHREERGRAGFYGFGVYARRLLDILAITFLTRFTQKPLRFFGSLGFLSILAGVLMSIEPLLGRFTTWLSETPESLVNRPLFMLAVLAVAFGFQLIGFGLVGEIIIFTQAKNLGDVKLDEAGRGGEGEPVDSGLRREETAGALRDESLAFAEPPAATDGRHVALAVRETLPGEDARWDAFVRRHPRGTFFHLSGWRKVVEDRFHHRSYCLVAERNRKVVGVLPLFLVKSPFVGKQLVSTPYAVYGGILADDDAAEAALLGQATETGRRLGVGYLELRHLEPRASVHAGLEGRDRSDLYVTFRKELPARADDVMPAIPKKARAEVRRARDKFAMTFHDNGTVASLYGLFALNKRRLGSPSLPRSWFAALEEEFGRQVVVHEVRTKEGEVAAAVMSFLFRDTVYAYYSGSREEHHKTGMMDFAYCNIMEWGVAQGFRVFDFGRSRKDSGAASFKRNMGFVDQPMPYDYVLLGKDAKLPEFHPSNPKLALPRRVWASLPLFLTTWLGGRLSRYLP